MQLLTERYQDYKRNHPRAWPRDVAKTLGVSEAELIAAGCGVTAERLEPDWDAFFHALPGLGRVKTLTRNETAVLEKWGAFETVELFGNMGQVVGTDIDLRMFLARYGSLFYVEEERDTGVRRSLQLFDTAGTSIHKLYVEPETNDGAFESLVELMRPTAPLGTLTTVPDELPPLPRAVEDVDLTAFRAEWDAMRDTHEFFGLLRKHGLPRTQALELAGSSRARRVPSQGFRTVLDAVAAQGFAVMFFVGNRGMTQIFSGQIHKVVPKHGFLNVLDPGFNLHVREDQLEQAWVVQKPTADGIVTSLELYDSRGENVVLMFGKRKPGIPESEQWRAVLRATFE